MANDLVQIGEFDNFSDARSAALLHVEVIHIDVVVRRAEDRWILLVTQSDADLIDDLGYEKTEEEEERELAHYQACEDEDQQRAAQEWESSQREHWSEMLGESDDHSRGEETGWIYSDEDEA